MSDAAQELGQICNFRLVGVNVGTAGQPTADQFRVIAQAGFQAVINLALPTSDLALPNEGSLVTSLGMAYVHIPVDFTQPSIEAFRLFCRTLGALEPRRVFVHCVANKRVSAFLYLYRVLEAGMSPGEAALDLHAVWKPDPIWSEFIETVQRSG